MYLAGTFDSLVTISGDLTENRYRLHYNECVVNAKMSHTQLALNVSTFVDGRPELQGKPVQAGLIEYLLQLCGRPSS